MKQKIKLSQKFRVNVGKWERGSINNKVAQWASNEGYAFYFDRRQYIHVKISSIYYVIHDIFQDYEENLIIEFRKGDQNER